MHADTAISVSHVSKRYTIGAQKDGSLRGTLAGMLGSKQTKNQEEFWALNDVSFDIKKGEVIGIIGKNGAGKSTLLKILSQITKPTSGRIEISGRVASLLEVGTGFHPELTGRENIYLNGTILGMSRQEVKDKFEEIVEFSGVQKFIDTPVKHYSSGMYVRLAFAVAAHLEPEILIIDEVLAVGDAEFQKKCLGKMKEVAGHGRTVIFVSHNLSAVASLCSRGIVLDKGHMIFQGTAKESIAEYYKMSQRNFDRLDLSDYDNEFIRLIDVKIEAVSGDLITTNSGIQILLEFENKVEGASIDSTIEVRTVDDVTVFHRGTYIDDENASKKGVYRVSAVIEPHILNAGTYYVNLIFGQNSTYLLLLCAEIMSFDVENEADENGYKLLPGILKPRLNFTSQLLQHEQA
jgi:lipopolysaccharide transport system ATP-binding protein